MSAPLYIQALFASQLAGSLGFKRTNSYTWNGRCPLCGDSQKNKSKKRGYIYNFGQTLNYACHNCGASTSFEKFLKNQNEVLYREFKLETLKDSGQAVKEIDDLSKYKTKIPENLKSSWLELMTPVSEDAEVVKYLKSRQIPESKWNCLYVTDTYRELVNGLANLYGVDLSETKIPNDRRLVIPFVRDGAPSYIQGRTLTDSSIRYITTQLLNDFKIFSSSKVDESKDIFVFEGPLDSLFIENSCATADADLKKAAQVYPKNKLVLCFDNEPRSHIACSKIESALREGYRVVIPSYSEEYKDINEAFKAGIDVQRICEQYQFAGASGLLQLGKWRKC